MTQTIKQYAYSLKEFAELITIGIDFHNSDTFKEVTEVIFGNENYFNADLPTGTKIENIWQRVCNEYEDKYAIILDKEATSYTETELKEFFKQWFKKFVDVYFNTNDYYEAVLKAYDDKKTHLLDQVKSTSDNTVKFNDIPQVESGDFTGDSYATTFTHSEGENNSDFATTMTRLKEIQDDFKNIWHDWLYEFRSIFYEDNWEVM